MYLNRNNFGCLVKMVGFPIFYRLFKTRHAFVWFLCLVAAMFSEFWLTLRLLIITIIIYICPISIRLYILILLTLKCHSLSCGINWWSRVFLAFFKLIIVTFLDIKKLCAILMALSFKNSTAWGQALLGFAKPNKLLDLKCHCDGSQLIH